MKYVPQRGLPKQNILFERMSVHLHCTSVKWPLWCDSIELGTPPTACKDCSAVVECVVVCGVLCVMDYRGAHVNHDEELV